MPAKGKTSKNIQDKPTAFLEVGAKVNWSVLASHHPVTREAFIRIYGAGPFEVRAYPPVEYRCVCGYTTDVISVDMTHQPRCQAFNKTRKEYPTHIMINTKLGDQSFSMAWFNRAL